MAGTLEFLYKSRLADSLGTLEHFYGHRVHPQKVLKIQNERQMYLIVQEHRL